ncbi:MAG TPA: hypothetical protein VJG32_17960 [Anaerolineae bacterium]|nr:hypothetical protein [Anaerolineae bacterium]
MKTRLFLSLLLAGAMVFGVFAGVSLASVRTAGADGGVTGYTLSTLAAGTTRYTTTVTYITSTVSVPNYGAVDVQLTIDTTGTQVLTLVPQFSLAPTTQTCAQASQWFTATSTVIDTASATEVGTTVAVTETEGSLYPVTTTIDSAWTYTLGSTDIVHSMAQTGDGSIGREFPVFGRCFRAKLIFSAAGQWYTPTIWLRYVNRQ